MTPPPPYQDGAKMKAFVYLLRSMKNNRHYIGWTTDIKRRLDEHNSGKSYHTKTRGSWKLMGYETYNSSEEAKKREYALKHSPNMMFLFKKRLTVASKDGDWGDPTTSLHTKGVSTTHKEVVG